MHWNKSQSQFETELASANARIKELEEAQQSLRSNETTLRRAIQNMREVFYIREASNFKFIFVNPACEQVYGCSIQSLQEDSNSFIKTIDEPFRPSVYAALEKQAKGEATEIEYRITRPDGTYRWLRDRAFPMCDEQGNLENITCFIEDVTLAKEAEQSRRATEENYRSLVEFSENPIALIDRDGQILYSNPKGIEIWNDPQIVGKTIFNIFPEEYSRRYEAAIQHVIDTQAGLIDDAKTIVNGQKMWFRLSMQPVRNPDGTVSHLQLSAWDITERKLAEEAIRASESLLHHAQGMAQLGSWTADLTQKTFDASPECARLVGWEPGIHTEAELYQSIHPDDVARQQSTWLAATSGAPYDIEYRILLKGEVHWLHVRAEFEFDSSGTPVKAIGITQDITERKQAEQALRASEEKYRSLSEELERRVINRTAEVLDLYNQAPCGYHSLDGNGCFIHINDTELNWLGYTREEILGRPVAEIIASESLPVFQASFPEYKQRGWLKDLELIFRRKDGSTFPILVNATTQLDSNGQFVISRSTVFDQTERKQAELALRSSRERLNFLLAKTPAIIFTTGLSFDMPITFISDSVRNILGHEPRQYLENSGFWLSMVHPDDIPSGNVAIQLLFEKGYTNWQCRVQKTDGNYRWMSTGISLLQDSQGQPQEYIGFTVDIDDQKKAEAALQESEEQNRLLFEESPDGIVLLDDEGNIIRINRAFEALAGLQHEKLFGRNAGNLGLTSEKEMERIRQTFFQSSTNHEPFTTAEFRLNYPDNSTRNLESRIFQLKINGKNHVLVSSRDISIHIQAEEKLRMANAELERAVRVKDEFMASMSHELRTPLTGILGISEGLQEFVYGSLNEKQLKALANIEGAGRHLLDLINDILDVSKLEAGKIEHIVEPCDLRQICQASLQLIKGMANKKGHRVSFNMNPTDISLMADARRLKQIVVNLLSNAVKYTQPDGSLGLEVNGDIKEGFVQLSVWDKGIGIKPEDMDKLFRPFVQLDSSLSRQQTGTGLGLALVKHLVELHNGKVNVESTYGEGSRFTVTLPWNSSPKQPATEDTRPLSPTRVLTPESPVDENQTANQADFSKTSARVMLVDDNDINIKAISDFLMAKQYQVIVIHSGQEFLEQAPQMRPDIVLMDVQMPGMDGLTAIQRIRAHQDPRIAEIPIIAITALAMPGDRERCLAAGANDYQSKPIRLQRLTQLIAQMLKS
jgi:PAS domain S-box-containing protein